MRFKGTIVIVGVVGLMATLGCTATKKPASDQKPPEVTFGDQKKVDEPSAQPKAGGVPKRPAAALPAGSAHCASSPTSPLHAATLFYRLPAAARRNDASVAVGGPLTPHST